jgi:hypothetical protein
MKIEQNPDQASRVANPAEAAAEAAPKDLDAPQDVRGGSSCSNNSRQISLASHS